MQILGCRITREGHALRIYALKRIMHTPKAHGTQKPSRMHIQRGYDTAQRSNAPQKCIYTKCP